MPKVDRSSHRALESQPRYRVIIGDCVKEMRKLPACSVHSIICDPDYGVNTKNARDMWVKLYEPKAYQAFAEEWGREALRVATPGAWLAAMGAGISIHRQM